MTDPKPLAHPDVRFMFDGSGKPTQQAYEFLERLVKVTKDANAAIAALQAASNAPSSAAYIVQALSGSLSAERRLQAAAPITLTDGGANGDITIGINNTGTVLTALQNQYTANADLTTQIPHDDTTPTNTEGTQILSQAITLSNAANKVLALVTLNGSLSSAPNSWAGALFRGSTCIQAQSAVLDNALRTIPLDFDWLDTPGSVGPHTYTVRVGPAGGFTLRMNGTSSARLFGGVAACTLTLLEIKG